MNRAMPGAMALIQDSILLQNESNVSYLTNNKASKTGEPQESGRTTRSSSKKNNQQSSQETDSSHQTKSVSPGEKISGDNRGRKRKKNITNSGGGDDSDSDSDKGGDKNRPKLEVTSNKIENNDQSDLVVCSCPKNVMKCIGILPSLPIISYFCDSDESDSSFDDLSHVVLPTVSRNPPREKEEC